MLSNEYLDAKFGFDTEENEPLKVWGGDSIHYSILSLILIFFFRSEDKSNPKEKHEKKNYEKVSTYGGESSKNSVL